MFKFFTHDTLQELKIKGVVEQRNDILVYTTYLHIM